MVNITWIQGIVNMQIANNGLVNGSTLGAISLVFPDFRLSKLSKLLNPIANFLRGQYAAK